jgi:RNA polymerase sigma-70 factor (ECF subfamily)
MGGRGKPGDEPTSRGLAPRGDEAAAPDTAAAFQALYESTFEEVYAYLFHRCGGVQSMAEDLTQETYLAGVASFRSGEGENVSLPWLITVARNKLVDHYRKREREERKLSLIVNHEASRDTAERNYQIPRERALDALAAVPAEQRAALVLKYLDGLPVAEIAGLLGKSVHATESLLSRGRRTLKRRFEEVLDD